MYEGGGSSQAGFSSLFSFLISGSEPGHGMRGRRHLSEAAGLRPVMPFDSAPSLDSF